MWLGSLEGMSIASLLYRTHDLLVDDKAEGDSEEGQGQVCQDTDQGEDCQTQQDCHHGAKHHAGLLHISPVDQVHHWGGRGRGGVHYRT